MRIFPLSESALTVEFGTEISPALNDKAISFCQAVKEINLPGFIEAVSAYASTTIFFDPEQVRNAFPGSPIETVERLVRAAAEAEGGEIPRERMKHEIRFRWDDASAPDLFAAAESFSLSPAEFIDIFCSVEYRVYMLGFLPGFAYMGSVDERIALPRLATPRTRVPSGSIGIAGRQTGIYPFESPGGWQLIGRTEVTFFDANADKPSLLNPGDSVRFVRAD